MNRSFSTRLHSPFSKGKKLGFIQRETEARERPFSEDPTEARTPNRPSTTPTGRTQTLVRTTKERNIRVRWEQRNDPVKCTSVRKPEVHKDRAAGQANQTGT